MALPHLRVGFAWDNPSETLGGGPAFGREILRKIDRMRSECPHQLFMVTQQEPDPNIGNWNWLKASAPSRQNLSRQRFGKLLRRILSPGSPRILPSTGWSCHGRPLEERMDALFFLYPDCYEGLDIFQVSTVWDLSHRYVPFFPEIGNFRERDRREKLFEKIVRNASFLITGTERSRDELENYYGWEKSLVRLIPHPTPTSAIVFAQGAKVKNQSPPFALYPAQFWPHKNHLVLLQAWKILHESGWRDLKLVFTGSDQGNEAHIRKQAAELGLAEQVEFRGFVPKEELLQLYVDARMLVYPSLFGPENLPPLEAFALGCPVLAGDVPGAEEQLGDGALRLPPRDPLAWADAVRAVHGNIDRRNELIANGKRRATRTTTKTFALRIFSLIDEIADLRGLWAQGRPLMGETKVARRPLTNVSTPPTREIRLNYKKEHPGENAAARHLRICIVTPSMNQGAFLEQAMKSILDQGYPNLQYVVMDGGSRDHSPGIIQKYSKQLHGFRIAPDHGHYSAVNEGFRMMPGSGEDIMGWLNSDDMYTPWTFEVVNQIFTRFPSVNWISSLYPILWGQDGLPHRTLEREKFSAPAFFSGENCGKNHLQQESTFWRRRLWEQAGDQLNPEWDLAGDFELWSRFFRHSHCYGVATILGGFREHPGQKTSKQIGRYVAQSKEILQKARATLPSTYLLRYQMGKRLAKIFGKRGFFQEKGWLAPNTFITFDPDAGWVMVGPEV